LDTAESALALAGASVLVSYHKGGDDEVLCQPVGDDSRSGLQALRQEGSTGGGVLRRRARLPILPRRG
jgi:hypothetical protein